MRSKPCDMRYLSYSPLAAPVMVASTMKSIHRLWRKLMPSFFPEKESMMNETMASSTPIHW